MKKKALFQLSYGVYIVCSQYEQNFSGCIINTTTQITAEEKPKISIAVNKENYTNELIQKSKKANISVLLQTTPFEFIGKFGFRTGREFDKLEGTNYKMGNNKIPVITENTNAYLECNVLQSIDVGTHTLFILEVEEAEVLGENPVLTYDYYHRVIKGFTPPKASTYQGN